MLAGTALEPPDPAQVAAAVARYRACRALREFRARLYECLVSRPDASFELVDAILCADHAVTSLVQLSLAPEFRRGHGALYSALADGEIDGEKLAALLTGTLPGLVDGDEGGPGRLSTTRSTTACWTVPWPGTRRGGRAGAGGVRAVDPAAVRDRRHAVSPAGRRVLPGPGACPSRRVPLRWHPKTIPGWEYQFTAAIGHLRTAWAALIDVERTTPATRTRQTARQVNNLLRRLHAAGAPAAAAPRWSSWTPAIAPPR